MTIFGCHCATSLHSDFASTCNIARARSNDYIHLLEDAEFAHFKTSTPIERAKKVQFHWTPPKIIQGIRAISSVFLLSILTSCFFGSTQRLSLALGTDTLRVCRRLGIGSGWSMCVTAGKVHAYVDVQSRTRTCCLPFSFVQVRSDALTALWL